MKNLIIVIAVVLLSSVQVFSQKGLAKKSTIDFSVDMKPGSRYALTRSDNVEGEFPDRMIPLLSLRAEYKIAVSERLAIGLIYDNGKADFGSYKFETREDYYDYNTGDYIDIDEVYAFNSPAINTSYGVSLNLYTKGFVAPVGNSISFYYKRNFSKVEEVNYSYIKETNNIVTADIENSSLVLKANALGVSFNGMVFLSDKAPFYINYGLGMGFLFGSKVEFDGKEIDKNNQYDEKKFRNFRNVMLYNEVLNFRVGIGYWL
jgi:hypothetical protein